MSHPMDFGPCLPPCLRQGLLFASGYTSLADLRAPGASASASHLTVVVWGNRRGIRTQVLAHARNCFIHYTVSPTPGVTLGFVAYIL